MIVPGPCITCCRHVHTVRDRTTQVLSSGAFIRLLGRYSSSYWQGYLYFLLWWHRWNGWNTNCTNFFTAPEYVFAKDMLEWLLTSLTYCSVHTRTTFRSQVRQVSLTTRPWIVRNLSYYAIKLIINPYLVHSVKLGKRDIRPCVRTEDRIRK